MASSLRPPRHHRTAPRLAASRTVDQHSDQSCSNMYARLTPLYLGRRAHLQRRLRCQLAGGCTQQQPESRPGLSSCPDGRTFLTVGRVSTALAIVRIFGTFLGTCRPRHTGADAVVRGACGTSVYAEAGRKASPRPFPAREIGRRPPLVRDRLEETDTISRAGCHVADNKHPTSSTPPQRSFVGTKRE